MFEKIYARVVICTGILCLIAPVGCLHTFVGLPDNHQDANCYIAGFIMLLAMGIIFIAVGLAGIHDEKSKQRRLSEIMKTG
jgi:hypothetical protein